MLAKYDFLDLTFRVPDHLLRQSNYQSGVSLLRQLLPVQKPSDEEELYEEIDELFNGLLILEMLAEDVDAGLTLCRILLKSQSPRSFTERVRMSSLTSSIMILQDNYFPPRLTIRDACLTNAQAVWLL